MLESVKVTGPRVPSPIQAAALGALAGGPLRAAALARAAQVKPGYVYWLLDRMRLVGWVTRTEQERSEGKGRVRWALTPAGAQAAELWAILQRSTR